MFISTYTIPTLKNGLWWDWEVSPGASSPVQHPLTLGRVHPGGRGCPGVTQLDLDIPGHSKPEVLQGNPVPAGPRLPHLEWFHRI